MAKTISELIRENTVLKNEAAKLKTSLQFHTDQWEENYKTLDIIKNELLQNKKHHQQQQQPVIPYSKETKDKLNDLENGSRSNNLRIDGTIEEENKLGSKSEKKIIKDQLQFERHIEIECAHRCEKTMIDRAPNKRRTIVTKFLNILSF